MQFQPEKRVALLELLSQGMRLMEAAAEIEVSPQQIWGRARFDPAWGAELQATIDRARPTEVGHGRQSAYRQAVSKRRHGPTFWPVTTGGTMR